MSHPPNHTPPNLPPINTRIQLLIHKPTHRHVLPAYHIEAMFYLRAGFFVVGRPNHALDGVREDEVGLLVEGEEEPEEGAAVRGEDEDSFCGRRLGLERGVGGQRGGRGEGGSGYRGEGGKKSGGREEHTVDVGLEGHNSAAVNGWWERRGIKRGRG